MHPFSVIEILQVLSNRIECFALAQRGHFSIRDRGNVPITDCPEAVSGNFIPALFNGNEGDSKVTRVLPLINIQDAWQRSILQLTGSFAEILPESGEVTLRESNLERVWKTVWIYPYFR